MQTREKHDKKITNPSETCDNDGGRKAILTKSYLRIPMGRFERGNIQMDWKEDEIQTGVGKNTGVRR